MDVKLTFKGVKIKSVLPPLPVPLRTGSGILTHAPVLLVDILSEEGVVGLSYLFSPRKDLLKCLKEGIDAIAALLIGREMDPAKVSDHFRFRIPSIWWIWDFNDGKSRNRYGYLGRSF